MSTETSARPATQPPAGSPCIQVGPNAMEGLKLYEREIATYRRELPHLLERGEAGRYVLIKGDEIVTIWDTWGDANQAATERFGLDDTVFIKMIDPRDPQRYVL